MQPASCRGNNENQRQRNRDYDRDDDGCALTRSGVRNHRDGAVALPRSRFSHRRRIESPARHGLDVTARPSTVAQHFAKLRNSKGEVALLYETVGPQRFDSCRLPEELAAVKGEDDEQVEALGLTETGARRGQPSLLRSSPNGPNSYKSFTDMALERLSVFSQNSLGPLKPCAHALPNVTALKRRTPCRNNPSDQPFSL